MATQRASAVGDVFPVVTIEVYGPATGTQPNVIERITLKDAVITSLRELAGANVPAEELTLTAKEIIRQSSPPVVHPGAVQR